MPPLVSREDHLLDYHYSLLVLGFLVEFQLLCTGFLRTGSNIPKHPHMILPLCIFAKNYLTLSGSCTKKSGLVLAR